MYKRLLLIVDMKYMVKDLRAAGGSEAKIKKQKKAVKEYFLKM